MQPAEYFNTEYFSNINKLLEEKHSSQFVPSFAQFKVASQASVCDSLQ